MSAEPSAYLDSSAFVKLVNVEAESQALEAYLSSWPRWVSSALLRAEGLRAARRSGTEAFAAAQVWLSGMSLLPVDDATLNEAGSIGAPMLRTLDAIHLATAQQLGSDLGVVVTYDRRLAEAAAELGLPVAAPA